jgi:hypothetical protein
MAAILIFVPCLAGCTTPSTSSGFIDQGMAKPILPPGVPRKVGVVPFAGDVRISVQSADQFAGGLLPLGFEVVERQQLQSVLDELKYQHGDFVNPETRKRLKEQLGIEGLFLGSITGESSPTWVDSHLNLRLIDVETGRVLWAAEVHDPRVFGLSMDIHTSATYTVKNALDILKKDLKSK